MCAISAERRATFCAVGCGVVTIRNFACGSSCASVIETSPVPGGRSIEQEVELAPVDVLEELRERLVEHRAAPDDGAVLLDEEADRHDLDAAVRLEREDLALGRDRRALRAEAEHARDRVAPDVGVEHADAACPRRPARRRGSTVSVDLPTPPLPEPTQMTFCTCGERALGQRRRGRASAAARPSRWSERTSKATLTRGHAVERRARRSRRRSGSGCGSGSPGSSARR